MGLQRVKATLCNSVRPEKPGMRFVCSLVVIAALLIQPVPSLGNRFLNSLDTYSDVEDLNLDVGGFKFPPIPRGSLQDFDVERYLEGIKVPDPLPILSKVEKVKLAESIHFPCGLAVSFVRGERTISARTPIYKAMLEYYPSLRKAEFQKRLVLNGRVSVNGLAHLLPSIVDEDLK